jgi:hypothetical protein
VEEEGRKGILLKNEVTARSSLLLTAGFCNTAPGSVSAPQIRDLKIGIKSDLRDFECSPMFGGSSCLIVPFFCCPALLCFCGGWLKSQWRSWEAMGPVTFKGSIV